MRREFLKLRDVDAGNLLGNHGGFRALHRQRAVAWRVVGKCDVIHDDVFFERFDQALANHGVGSAKEPVLKRVRLNLCENVALRIEQQRNDALACRKVLDVVGQDGVQVAHAVGPGKGKIGAVVLVDQRHGLPRRTILGRRVAKVLRQRASEPNAHLRARGKVRRRKRSVHCRACRCRFQEFACPPGSNPTKGSLTKRGQAGLGTRWTRRMSLQFR